MAYKINSFTEAVAFFQLYGSARNAFNACRSARQRRHYARLWLENSVHLFEPNTLLRARNARLRTLDYSYSLES